MGNCVCQQTSRDTQADQSFDNSSTCHGDLDSTDNGIVCRIQNVRRNINSSNDEDGTISDNEDEQISLEDSASIHDGIDTHTESSNELHSPSERVLSPLIVSFISPESLHEEPRFEEESNIEDLSEDSFVGLTLDSYYRQNERIAHPYINPAVNNDLQQLLNEIESNVLMEMERDDDIESIDDSYDGIDDVEILFDDNTADSSDKRVYVDGNSCEICVSDYNEINHRPVIIPCGHMLCLHCVRQISKRKHYRSMECPMDRIEHSITVKKTGKTVFKERNVDKRRHAVYGQISHYDLESNLEI